MAFLDSDGQDFDSSPGFSGTQATSLALPEVAPGGTGDAGVAEQYGFRASPPSGAGLNLSGADIPGLALAAPKPSLSDQEYLDNLPTREKIGLALQAFSAGVAGRESPIDKLLKNRREEQREARRELVDTTTILTKAFEESRKYGPDTLQGKAVLGAYKKLLPPELAGALDAVGTENEDQVRSLTGLVSDPDVQSALVKVCGRDRACWVKQVNEKDWLQTQYATVDTKRMAQALPKLRAFKEQVIDKGGLDAKRDADGKVTLSWPELVEGNAKLKLFSDAEMDTFRRNPEYLIPYGIKTTKALSAGEVEAAKLAERPTKEDFKEGQTRSRLDMSGAQLSEEFRNGKWVVIGRRPHDKPDKPLTPAQIHADNKKLEARDAVEAEGLDWKNKSGPNGTAKFNALMKKYSEKELNKEGQDNPDYDSKRASALQRDWRAAGGVLNSEIKQERDVTKPGTDKPIRNKDGTVTTERSITVTDERINGGKPTNIPTVWGGKVVSDDEAIANAAKSGAKFQSFNSIDEAVAAAKKRSADLGTGRTTSVGGARGTGGTFNLASWEKTKKIHNLTDAELEKRLGKKKPAK